ncbi:hypothetical protein B0H14DRAFT_2608056 [Mycena olivaceomarginata]|nr:hypothetical protein B0H14DRAFT_2608056 [Mycena olivaceomarginata]
MMFTPHPFYYPEIHANNGYKIEELQISSALLSRLKNLEELALDGPGDLHINCASVEKLLGANCPTLKELQLKLIKTTDSSIWTIVPTATPLGGTMEGRIGTAKVQDGRVSIALVLTK